MDNIISGIAGGVQGLLTSADNLLSTLYNRNMDDDTLKYIQGRNAVLVSKLNELSEYKQKLQAERDTLSTSLDQGLFPDKRGEYINRIYAIDNELKPLTKNISALQAQVIYSKNEAMRRIMDLNSRDMPFPQRTLTMLSAPNTFTSFVESKLANLGSFVHDISQKRQMGAQLWGSDDMFSAYNLDNTFTFTWTTPLSTIFEAFNRLGGATIDVMAKDYMAYKEAMADNNKQGINWKAFTLPFKRSIAAIGLYEFGKSYFSPASLEGANKLVEPMLHDISSMGIDTQFMRHKMGNLPLVANLVADLTPADILSTTLEMVLDVSNLIPLGFAGRSLKLEKLASKLARLGYANPKDMAKLIIDTGRKIDDIEPVLLQTYDGLISLNKIQKEAGLATSLGYASANPEYLHNLAAQADTIIQSLENIVPNISRFADDVAISADNVRLGYLVDNTMELFRTKIDDSIKAYALHKQIDNMIKNGEDFAEKYDYLVAQMEDITNRELVENLRHRVDNIIESGSYNYENGFPVNNVTTVSYGQFPGQIFKRQYNPLEEADGLDSMHISFDNTVFSPPEVEDMLNSSLSKFELFDIISNKPGIGVTTPDYISNYHHFAGFSPVARQRIREELSSDLLGDVFRNTSVSEHDFSVEDEIIREVNRKIAETGVRDYEWAIHRVLHESRERKPLPNGKGEIWHGSIAKLFSGAEMIVKNIVGDTAIVINPDGTMQYRVPLSDIESARSILSVDINNNSKVMRGIFGAFNVSDGSFFNISKTLQQIGLMEIFFPPHFSNIPQVRRVARLGNEALSYLQRDVRLFYREIDDMFKNVGKEQRERVCEYLRLRTINEVDPESCSDDILMDKFNALFPEDKDLIEKIDDFFFRFKVYAYKTLSYDEGARLPYGTVEEAALDGFREFGLEYYFPLHEKGQYAIFRKEGRTKRSPIAFVDSEKEATEVLKFDMLRELTAHYLQINPDQQLQEALATSFRLDDLVSKLRRNNDFLTINGALMDDILNLADTPEVNALLSAYEFNLASLSIDTAEQLKPAVRKAMWEILNDGFPHGRELRLALITSGNAPHIRGKQYWSHGLKNTASIKVFFDNIDEVMREYTYSTVKKRYMGWFKQEAYKDITNESPSIREYIDKTVDYITGRQSPEDAFLQRYLMARFGINLGYRPLSATTNAIKDVINTIKLGFRLKSAIVQLTQPLATTAAMTSFSDLMRGYAKLGNKDRGNFIANILGIKFSEPITGSPTNKLCRAALYPFALGDEVNRHVSALAAMEFWDGHFADIVARELGLSRVYKTDDIIRLVRETGSDYILEINDKLNEVEEGLGEYYRKYINYVQDIVNMSQFVYNKSGKALWLRNSLMDLIFGQYRSYALSKSALTIDMLKELGDMLFSKLPVTSENFMRRWDVFPKFVLTNLALGGLRAVPGVATGIATLNALGRIFTKDSDVRKHPDWKFGMFNIDHMLQRWGATSPTRRKAVDALRHGFLSAFGYDISASFANDLETAFLEQPVGNVGIFAPFGQVGYYLFQLIGSSKMAGDNSKYREAIVRSLLPSVVLDAQEALKLYYLKRNIDRYMEKGEDTSLASLMGIIEAGINTLGLIDITKPGNLSLAWKKRKDMTARELIEFYGINSGKLPVVGRGAETTPIARFYPTDVDIIMRLLGVSSMELTRYREAMARHASLTRSIGAEKNIMCEFIARVWEAYYNGEMDEGEYSDAIEAIKKVMRKRGIALTDDTIENYIASRMEVKTVLTDLLTTADELEQVFILDSFNQYMSIPSILGDDVDIKWNEILEEVHKYVNGQ